MTNGQHVLVVDGLAETEEVLKAVLEPQGLKVNRIRTDRSRANPAVPPPHLVILHEDQPGTEADDSWQDIPRVIIGSIHLPGSTSEEASPHSRAHYLSQPFHYGELIQAVENLLAE